MINYKNPWTPQDEQEHYPCTMEWWCAEAFFTSLTDKKEWSMKAVFTEWLEKAKTIGSIQNITVFDHAANTHYILYERNDTKRLEVKKNIFDVHYKDSFMKGSYPSYVMHFHDPNHDIILDLSYTAVSLPHWVAQDITGGWLPMGLGAYRYGFIPRNTLSGTLTIHGKTQEIKGQGYFEHVWGDFFYDNPVTNTTSLFHMMGTYAKLIGWWMKNHQPRIPESLMFSTENNPFGYDWVWALLDNGWSLFLGNIMFWLMEGPIAGSLILTKDGKTYTEFSNVSFKYNNLRYGKEHDFYYPSELEITAIKGTEQLHLTFTMTVEPREYLARFSGGTYWTGLVICEAPGVVNGEYTNGKDIMTLTGICKIEPQRQLSVLGHNSLRIDITKPPQGIGIDFDLVSHYLRKKLTINMHLLPRPQFQFKVIPLRKKDFSTSIRKR